MTPKQAAKQRAQLERLHAEWKASEPGSKRRRHFRRAFERAEQRVLAEYRRMRAGR